MNQFTGQDVRKTFQVEQPAGPKALGQEGFWLTGRTERRLVYPEGQIGTKNWDEDGEE